VVDEIRPRIIVLENVPGFAVHGLPSILGGLEDIEPGGWRSEWLCLPASAVGAPHRRERFFGLFVSDPGGAVLWDEPRRGSGAGGASTPEPRHLGAEHLADSERRGCNRGNIGFASSGAVVSAPLSGEMAPWPPGPSDSDGWREWLDAGGPAPTLESELRRGSDGTPAGLEFANDRLRCLGNAVVPLQAAAAIGELARRLRAR
jgi:DNA (cytosine-5)-methyltransferase 1